MSAPDKAEFSRPIDLASIGAAEVERKLAADDIECRGLAQRFALQALQRLEAVVHLRRSAGGLITASGHLSARLVQACVITLEPIDAEIEADFTRTYSERAAPTSAEVTIDAETDEPEAIEDGRIDLGELVAEELALAIDPYPRKPGAEFRAGLDEGDDGRRHRGG